MFFRRVTGPAASVYRPAQVLAQYVAARPRSLERCTYFRRVRLDLTIVV